MKVSIKSEYIDTVADIISGLFEGKIEQVSVSGSTVVYSFEDEDLKNDIEAWCDSAQSCLLVYDYKFSY